MRKYLRFCVVPSAMGGLLALSTSGLAQTGATASPTKPQSGAAAFMARATRIFKDEEPPKPAISPPAASPSDLKLAEPMPTLAKPENKAAEITAPATGTPLPAATGPMIIEELPGGMQLDDLIKMSLERSPNIREALTAAEAARAKAYQAGLYPNPQASTSSPQLAGNQSQYNVFFNQEIVVKGKLNLDQAAAYRYAREQELKLLRTRFDLMTDIRQQFYLTLAAQKRIEVLQHLQNIARTSKQVGDRLFKGGEGTRTDAILLDIELDRAQVALDNANVTLQAQTRRLAAVAGMANLNIGSVIGDIDTRLPEYEMIALQEGVVSRNALAQIAQVEIERSELLLHRAEVEPYPNLNMMGGWQYQLSGAQSPLNQGIYQVTMTMPLWNKNQGNIRAAQQSVGTAQAQLSRVRNELAGDAADALGRYVAARQLVERYEQQILPKARETQRLTQQLYADGHLDAHEHHLIAKVADLLYVPHGQYIAAKLRAKESTAS